MIYITRDGQQFGPYSLEEAKAYVQGGQLCLSDLAQQEGETDWAPLYKVLGLPAPTNMPPPLLKTSDTEIKVSNIDTSAQRFKPSWYCWVYLALCSAILFSVKSSTGYNISYCIGSVVGLFLLGILISWISWRVCRKSKLVGNAAFLIIVTLSLLGNCAGSLRRLQENVQVKKLKNETAEILASHDGDPLKRMKKAQALFTKSAEDASPADKLVIEATTAFLTAASNEYQKWEALSNEVFPVFNLDNIKTREDISKAKEQTQKFLDGTVAYKQWTKNIDNLYKAELEKRNVPQRALEGALTGFRSGKERRDISVKLRESDEEFASKWTSLLDLLENQFGTWSYKEETDLLEFQNPEVQKTADALSQRIKAIIEEQLELETKMKKAEQSAIERLKK